MSFKIGKILAGVICGRSGLEESTIELRISYTQAWPDERHMRTRAHVQYRDVSHKIRGSKGRRRRQSGEVGLGSVVNNCNVGREFIMLRHKFHLQHRAARLPVLCGSDVGLKNDRMRQRRIGSVDAHEERRFRVRAPYCPFCALEVSLHSPATCAKFKQLIRSSLTAITSLRHSLRPANQTKICTNGPTLESYGGTSLSS